MAPWSTRVHTLKRHLDRFSHFCRATEHGRFNRIRQVARMCTPCNTCGSSGVNRVWACQLGEKRLSRCLSKSLVVVTIAHFIRKLKGSHNPWYNSNNSSTCPGNMVNFGLLTAEICPRVTLRLLSYNITCMLTTNFVHLL